MFARIIILDIDGVLNFDEFAGRAGTYELLDPACVQILRGLVEKSKAEIVLSSSKRIGRGWRERVLDAFRDAGWPDPPIIDRTPDLPDASRGEEIHWWIENHPTERFVIIDDDPDVLERQLPFFVRTKGTTEGLTTALARQALEILSR